MSIHVAVAGATGYAGGELLRLLAGHPELHVQTVTAHSSAGRQLGEVAPHLRAFSAMTVKDTSLETLRGHDVVFLALPHGASGKLAAQLGPETLVVDAGADHRLQDPQAWQDYYGSEHAGSWPYGLPELIIDPSGTRQRSQLSGVNRIAVPGCYPTGAQLGLAPGLAAGVLEAEDIVIVSASGLSGVGKSLKPHLLGAETTSSMSPYGVGGVHRHIPEIEQGLGWAGGQPVTVSFTPTLAPMPRGILTTATARLRGNPSDAEVRAVYEQAYQDEPFVHLLPEGQWPATQNVQGSNHVDLQLAVDRHAGRVIITAAIDNLTKGTAGGALQSANIALGLAETAGLGEEGLAP